MNKDLDRFLSRRFSTMDDNGDGQLESCDFIVSVWRLGKEFGHDVESPQWKHLADLTTAWWEHLVRVSDLNTDGLISEEEYKTAFYKGLLETPESFDAVYKPYLSAIMDIIDADHDGRLTVEDEIRYAGSLMRIPAAEAREIFRRLDSDGDGFITKEDLLEAIRAAYFDDSAESPRHWVLGPLDQPIELLNNNNNNNKPPRGIPEIEFHRRGWWGFELHCNDEAVELIEYLYDKLFRRIGRFLPRKVRVAIHVWLKARRKILKVLSHGDGVRMLSPWPIPILLAPLPMRSIDWGNPGTGAPLPPPPPAQDTGLRYTMGDFWRVPAEQWSEETMFPDGHGSFRAPALAEFRGRLYCAHTHQSSQFVYWNVYDPENGWREDQQNVSANFFSGAAPALAVFRDRLYCFARLYNIHTPFQPSSIAFSMFDGNTWDRLPTSISIGQLRLPPVGDPSGPAAVVFRGELYVFFRASVGHNTPIGLWYVRMGANNQWSEPVRVRDFMPRTGAAVVVHRDRLVCIYAADNTNLMLTWFDGTNWSVPRQVLHHQTGEDPALTSLDGQIFCVFRHSTNDTLLCVGSIGSAQPPDVNSSTPWPQIGDAGILPHRSATGVGLAVYTDPHMLENCPDFDASNRPRPQLMAVFRGTTR